MQGNGKTELKRQAHLYQSIVGPFLETFSPLLPRWVAFRSQCHASPAPFSLMRHLPAQRHSH